MKKAAALALTVALIGSAQAADKLKVGWIYIGPAGDYGWTYAHDQARKEVEKTLGVENLIVESVPEAQAVPYIDQLVKQGAKVIFATSFGYGPSVKEAAKKYPDVIFGWATGVERGPNIANYMADFYQIYYLNGMIAGALTKTNKVGYVAAVPIPEVKRHINAFALGVAAVNPKATVNVTWLKGFYDPNGAKEATESMIAQGVDAFAFTEDTPTVAQVADKKGLPSFGHYSPMLKYAPKTMASGQLVDWSIIYTDFLKKVQKGTYTSKNLQNVDYWYLLGEKAVSMGADEKTVINPVYKSKLQSVKVKTADLGTLSVYDLVMKRLAQMSKVKPAFDPFTGPIVARNGKTVVSKGKILSVKELTTMEWAAKNVVGSWPNEPK